MTNQEKLLSILDKAYQEGVDSYTPTPIDEDIPLHNITNSAVDEFLNELPLEGYKQTDISLLVPQLFKIEEDSEASWTESINPYIVRGDGDTVVMTDSKGVSVEYTPYRNTFRLMDLMPDEVYSWKMMKSGKVVNSGQFKTYGKARLIGLDKLVNFRDLYVPNYVKPGKVYRGANPDSVELDSNDHKTLQRLGINVQINLRTASQDPPRTDLFAQTYSYNISDYTDILTNTTNVKNVVTALANSLASGKIVYFNCFAGADRTGTLSYLIQALCGVPQGILEAHWELTSLCRWCNSKLWSYERKDYTKGELRSFVANITKLYGNDPYTQAYRYFTEKCKIDKTVLDKIINNLKA